MSSPSIDLDDLLKRACEARLRSATRRVQEVIEGERLIGAGKKVVLS